jgi:hypothetical protein
MKNNSAEIRITDFLSDFIILPFIILVIRSVLNRHCEEQPLQAMTRNPVFAYWIAQ